MTVPGAYGLRFSGLVDPSALLAVAPEEWPVVSVEEELLEGDPGPAIVDGDRARIRLVGGGQLVLEREARTARFRLPTPLPPDELVHPYLAPVAATFATWLGRDSLHAGSFALDGGTVALLGPKEAGKSTTLAALASRGVSIVADDITVVEGGLALAGPRCLDVRPGSAADGVPARGGDRIRIRLPAIEPAMPLRGIVLLAWSSELVVQRLTPSERLVRVAVHRWDPNALRPQGPVELASLPAWELRRPRSIESLPAVCDLLLRLAGSL